MDPNSDVKPTLLIPLETGVSSDKPPTIEPSDIESLSAAGGAAIPEAITQTVISSDTAVVQPNYGQLLQAGLSHGGLQPSEIPQVRTTKSSIFFSMYSRICFERPLKFSMKAGHKTQVPLQRKG